MAKMNLLDALESSLAKAKTYVDGNFSKSDHTHKYAGSSSAGGAATSANKVNTDLTIKLNGGSTEGTDLFTFNGSAAKTLDITPSSIGAAAESHGTHVTWPTSAPREPKEGAAVIGSSTQVARADHRHPAQTTITGNAGSADKVNNSMKVQLNGGTTEDTNQFTFDGSAAKTVNITLSSLGHGSHLELGETSSTAYRGDYGKTAYDHSQAAHAPSNAQANQNAFSNFTIGSTTIAADSATDTLTIVAGSNITLTPDATNDKLTIAATDTTYNDATTSAAGLMTSAMVTKLNGIATGANNYSHPSTHAATMIVEDSTHRFVTDEEKAAWSNGIKIVALAQEEYDALATIDNDTLYVII